MKSQGEEKVIKKARELLNLAENLGVDFGINALRSYVEGLEYVVPEDEITD